MCKLWSSQVVVHQHVSHLFPKFVLQAVLLLRLGIYLTVYLEYVACGQAVALP